MLVTGANSITIISECWYKENMLEFVNDVKAARGLRGSLSERTKNGGSNGGEQERINVETLWNEGVC